MELDFKTLLNTRVSHLDQSDLAMVRDWFYPQHTKIDHYAGGSTNADGNDNDNTNNNTSAVSDNDDDHIPSLRKSRENNIGTIEFDENDDPDSTTRDKRRAIRRVGVYKHREAFDGNVPHFITATAELTDALLEYEVFCAETAAYFEKYGRREWQRQPQPQRQQRQHENDGKRERDTNFAYDNDDDSVENGRADSRKARPSQRPTPTHTATSTISTPTPISATAMQFILSASFCRFVNGFVDRDVTVTTLTASKRAATSTTTTTSTNSTKKLTQQEHLDSNLRSDSDSDLSLESESSSSSTSTSVSTAALKSNSNSKSRSKSKSNPKSGSRSKHKAKQPSESSMFTHAQKISMPRSFVELRHRCTHGRDLPRLLELKSAADEALDWLWKRYWVRRVKSDGELKKWELREIERGWRELEAVRERELVEEGERGGGGVVGEGQGEGDGEREEEEEGEWEARFDEDEKVWRIVFVTKDGVVRGE